jgi:hypothetical protein
MLGVYDGSTKSPVDSVTIFVAARQHENAVARGFIDRIPRRERKIVESETIKTGPILLVNIT